MSIDDLLEHDWVCVQLKERGRVQHCLAISTYYLWRYVLLTSILLFQSCSWHGHQSNLQRSNFHISSPTTKYEKLCVGNQFWGNTTWLSCKWPHLSKHLRIQLRVSSVHNSGSNLSPSVCESWNILFRTDSASAAVSTPLFWLWSRPKSVNASSITCLLTTFTAQGNREEWYSLAPWGGRGKRQGGWEVHDSSLSSFSEVCFFFCRKSCHLFWIHHYNLPPQPPIP